MNTDLVIPNPQKLQKLKARIRAAGPDRFHIVSDFDRTLTKAFVGEREVPSLISILRDGKYLTPDYAGKAHALYNKYHPIEMNPGVPKPEKKMAMHDWWMAHLKLLIASGLTKKDVERAVDSDMVQIREGGHEFLDTSKKLRIPLIFMSASGLGIYGIEYFLKKSRRLYENIHIISNSFTWDREDRLASVQEPIIHALNKDETVIESFPVFQEIKERKNVLLMGDNLGDIGMIGGFAHDNLITIGFLSSDDALNRELFFSTFDAVICSDGDMRFVNELLREMFPVHAEGAAMLP